MEVRWRHGLIRHPVSHRTATGQNRENRDSVELGSEPSNPPKGSLKPVQAATSAALGPLGPTIAEQFEQLPVECFKKKFLRWPWSDPYNKVEADKARELFEKGSSRLAVDYGDGVKPLKGEEALGVLQSQLLGQSAQKLRPGAELVTRLESRDAGSGESLKPYDAYLRLDAQKPIVVMEEGFPLARLENTGSAAEPRERVALKGQPHQQALLTLNALNEDFDHLTPALVRGARLQAPQEKLALDLLESFEDDRTAVERFAALEGSGDYTASRAALEPLGWSDAKQPSELLKEAHQMHLKFGLEGSVLAGLRKLFTEEHIFRDMIQDPVTTLVARFPKAEDTLRKLFVSKRPVEALTLASRLRDDLNFDLLTETTRKHSPEVSMTLLCGTASAFASEAVDLFEVLAPLRGAEEAVAEVNEILALVEGQRTENSDYRHKERVLGPCLNFYKGELLKPGREPARKLFLEQLKANNRRHYEVSWVFPEVKGLPLEQRIELYHSLREEKFPQERYQTVTHLIEAGRTLEQARAETELVFGAVEGIRTEDSDYRHKERLLDPCLNYYKSELLRPEREPARELFLEQLQAKNRRHYEVSWVLPQVDGLNLEQRIDLYGELRELKFPQERYETVIHLIGAGRGLEEAKTETTVLFEAVDASRTEESDYRHKERLLAPSLSYYKEQLVKPEREPARALFLDHLKANNRRQYEVSWVLPPVKNLGLEQRIELYHSLRGDSFPDNRYTMVADLMGAGRTLEEAKAEMETLFAAIDASRTEESDYRHKQYLLDPCLVYYKAELMKPERVPARELFLEHLTAKNRRYNEVRWVTPEIKGLNLEKRIELYRELREQSYPQERYDTVAHLMRAGRTLDQARAESSTLFAAVDASRTEESDYRHKQYLLDPCLEYYKEALLKPEREPARELFLEHLNAKNRRHFEVKWVTPEVKGLSLDQRIELYRELREQSYPQERYDTVADLMRAGRTLEQASAETGTLFAAVDASRTEEADYRHKQYLLDPCLEYYKEALLKPEREPARELFLEHLNAKNRRHFEVKWVTPEVKGLSLEQRIELYRELREVSNPQDRYQAAVDFIRAGRTLEQAKVETSTLFAAVDASRTEESDYQHQQKLLRPSLEFYKQELLSPEREPARQLFLNCLNEKRSTRVVRLVLDVPAGRQAAELTRLAEEVEFSEAATQMGVPLLVDGLPVEEAASRAKSAAEWVNRAEWRERQPCIEAFRSTNKAGRVLMMAALNSGFAPRTLTSTLSQLEARLVRMAQLEIDQEVVMNALRQVDPGVSLTRQLDAILEVLILTAEQDAAKSLEIEVSDEEVVVGDFNLPRQE